MQLILRMLLVVVLGWAGTAGAATAPDIEVFVREGCPHCAKAEEFLKVLQREQPELSIVVRDVEREPAALEELKRIAQSHGETLLRVPAFSVHGQLLVGYSDEATGNLIRDALSGHIGQTGPPAENCEPPDARPCADEKTGRYAITFLGHRVALDDVGLPAFTVVMGLLDGFNPCSMWVLILMISLLAPLNDRARMLTVAGTFVAVQGVAYFLFMAAWLSLFLLVGLSRISEIVIAALALLAGSIHLKDFWRFGQGVSLSIPASAKPGIYARMRRILQAENLTAALIGTVVLGVLVQIVELMCTSGFPALYTRILTLQQFDKPAYYAYLVLYDIAYMLDDMVVLAIGVVTLSQRRLQEKEGRWLKLVSGVAMVGLGIYLLLQ